VWKMKGITIYLISIGIISILGIVYLTYLDLPKDNNIENDLPLPTPTTKLDINHSLGINTTTTFRLANETPERILTLKMYEPKEVGWTCGGNYTTKVNSTFIGCVRK